MCGFGAGSGITVPVATGLIEISGPLATFGVLGLAYIVLVAGATLFMRDPPEGYRPEGYEPPEEGGEQEEQAYGFRGAFGTWQWYALWAMLFLNTTAGLAILSDAEAMASEFAGASAFLAAAFVAILAVTNTVGRLFWPVMGDRIGSRNVFLIMFLLQAALFALLPILGAGAFVPFTVLSFLVLLCYGGGFGAMPPFTGAYFGSRNVGTIYGAMLPSGGSLASAGR